MTDLTPHPQLRDLFAAHDLEPEAHNDWLLCDGVYPGIRAKGSGSRLNVDMALDAGQMVTESYPRDGGLELFRDGAFPLLLSAFWQRHDPNIVIRQTVRREDGPWQLFIGRYLRLVDDGERVPVPYPLFGMLEGYFRQAELPGDMHWLSTTVSITAAGAEADVRLDGVRRPELEAVIAEMDWPFDGRDHILRNAILLLKS